MNQQHPKLIPGKLYFHPELKSVVSYLFKNTWSSNTETFNSFYKKEKVEEEIFNIEINYFIFLGSDWIEHVLNCEYENPIISLKVLIQNKIGYLMTYQDVFFVKLRKLNE